MISWTTDNERYAFETSPVYISPVHHVAQNKMILLLT